MPPAILTLPEALTSKDDSLSLNLPLIIEMLLALSCMFLSASTQKFSEVLKLKPELSLMLTSCPPVFRVICLFCPSSSSLASWLARSALALDRSRLDEVWPSAAFSRASLFLSSRLETLAPVEFDIFASKTPAASVAVPASEILQPAPWQESAACCLPLPSLPRSSVVCSSGGVAYLATRTPTFSEAFARDFWMESSSAPNSPAWRRASSVAATMSRTQPSSALAMAA